MGFNSIFKLLNTSLRFPAINYQRFPLSTLLQRLPITAAIEPAERAIAGGSWSLIAIRTNIRNKFPRAKETKRIKVHGWNTRMSTLSGRKILMRRILRGRHVLSH